MPTTTTKVTLLAAGLRQVDLLERLYARGVDTNPSELSKVLNGYQRGPKANRILEVSDQILAEVCES